MAFIPKYTPSSSGKKNPRLNLLGKRLERMMKQHGVSAAKIEEIVQHYVSMGGEVSQVSVRAVKKKIEDAKPKSNLPEIDYRTTNDAEAFAEEREVEMLKVAHWIAKHRGMTAGGRARGSSRGARISVEDVQAYLEGN